MHECQGIIPEKHLTWNWSTMTGTHMAASNELIEWVKENSPNARFQCSARNVNNILIFQNDEEYALAKLVWGLHNVER